MKDTDQDGLPDGLEDTLGGLKDGNGVDLPDLKAMGAGSGKKDIFIEVGAMQNTVASKTYGGVAVGVHDHMPAADALKMVGDAFANAPVTIQGLPPWTASGRTLT